MNSLFIRKQAVRNENLQNKKNPNPGLK